MGDSSEFSDTRDLGDSLKEALSSLPHNFKAVYRFGLRLQSARAISVSVTFVLESVLPASSIVNVGNPLHSRLKGIRYEGEDKTQSGSAQIVERPLPISPTGSQQDQASSAS